MPTQRNATNDVPNDRCVERLVPIAESKRITLESRPASLLVASLARLILDTLRIKMVMDSFVWQGQVICLGERATEHAKEPMLDSSIILSKTLGCLLEATKMQLARQPPRPDPVRPC